MANNYGEYTVRESDGKVVYNEKRSETASAPLIGKTFLYLTIGLLITALTSAVVGILFTYFLPIDYSENVEFVGNYVAYFGLLIGSMIVLLIMSFVLNFTLLRGNKKANFVPFVIYTICMGIMLSSFTMFIEWYVITTSIGITTLIFALMCLIGYKAKRMSGLVISLCGISSGIFTLFMFWLIMSFVAPGIATAINIGISSLMFIYMMLITIFDMAMVKKFAASGTNSSNVALYLAYRLYVDFIYILIRILRIVLILFARRK